MNPEQMFTTKSKAAAKEVTQLINVAVKEREIDKEKLGKMIQQCIHNHEIENWYTSTRYPQLELNPVEGLVREKDTRKLVKTYKSISGDWTIKLIGLRGKNTNHVLVKNIMYAQFVKPFNFKHHLVIVNNVTKQPRVVDMELKARVVKKVVKSNKKRFEIIDSKDSDFWKILLHVDKKRYFIHIRKTSDERKKEFRLMEAKEELLTQHAADMFKVKNTVGYKY